MRRIFPLLTTLLFLVVTHQSGSAQVFEYSAPRHRDRLNNAVYGECVFINAAGVSYERIVGEYFSARAGLLVTPFGERNDLTFGALMTANGMIGGENFKAVAGAGVILPFSGGPLLPTATLGLRYLPYRGGFCWSVAWRPIFINSDGGYDDMEIGVARSGVGFTAGYVF